MSEQTANNGAALLSTANTNSTFGSVFIRVPHHSPYELFFDETTTVGELRGVLLAMVNSASDRTPGYIPWTDCRLIRRGVELKQSNNSHYVVKDLRMEDGEHIHGMLISNTIPEAVSDPSEDSSNSNNTHQSIAIDYDALDEVRRSLTNILVTIRREEELRSTLPILSDGEMSNRAARRRVERVLQASVIRQHLNIQPTPVGVTQQRRTVLASDDGADMTYSIPIIMKQIKDEPGIRGAIGVLVGALAPALSIVAFLCMSVVTLPSDNGYTAKYRVSQPKSPPPTGPAGRAIYIYKGNTQTSASNHTSVHITDSRSHIREIGVNGVFPTPRTTSPSYTSPSYDYINSVLPVFFAPYRTTYASLTNSEGNDALMINGHFSGMLRFSLGLLLGILINLLTGIFVSFANNMPIKVGP